MLGVTTLGASVFGIANSIKHNEAPVEVDAAAQRTMYVKIDNTNWLSADQSFQMHLWGDVNESYTTLTVFNRNENIFSIRLSVSDNTNFQIVRVDPKYQTERWNYTQDGVIGENNFFIVNNDGWSPSMTYGQCGAFESGEYYVNATDTGGSFSGSTTCYLYVFNNKLSIANAYQMTRMGESNLFYFNFTGQKFLAEGIVVVSAFGKFEPNNWSFVTAQSKDIIFWHGNVGSTAITLGPKEDGKCTCTGFETVSDGYLARSFGQYFLSLPLCYDAGGVTEQATTQWGKAKVVYNEVKTHLGTSVYIKNIAYDATSQELDKRAVVRYDTIIAKNGSDVFENFIGRNITITIARIPQLDNKTTNYVSLIVIISVMVLSTTTIAALIVIKKRRTGR